MLKVSKFKFFIWRCLGDKLRDDFVMRDWSLVVERIYLGWWYIRMDGVYIRNVGDFTGLGVLEYLNNRVIFIGLKLCFWRGMFFLYKVRLWWFWEREFFLWLDVLVVGWFRMKLEVVFVGVEEELEFGISSVYFSL